MRIAILGSGNMGAALGQRLAAAGHSVRYSFSRDPAKLERLAQRSGPRASAAEPADAVRGADVVLLAVHWRHVPKLLKTPGLRGKIVIDCTNPMNAEDDALAVGHRTSGGELVARRARGARVVKAFNTVPAELIGAGPSAVRGPPDVCYCGDDAAAKRSVARLIRQIGFHPVDCGPLKVSRYLEPFALVIVQLAYGPGRRPELGVKFLHPRPGAVAGELQTVSFL